jgi:hypothetical protein
MPQPEKTQPDKAQPDEPRRAFLRGSVCRRKFASPDLALASPWQQRAIPMVEFLHGVSPESTFSSNTGGRNNN